MCILDLNTLDGGSSMGNLKKACFIYINGTDYHEKEIEYSDWHNTIKLSGVKNIQYSAQDVAAPLLRAMKRDINSRMKKVFQGRLFHIERQTFDKSNDTKKMIIVGENCLVVKNGSFADEKILGRYHRYINRYQDMLCLFDTIGHDSYKKLVKIYQLMMEDKIDPFLLMKACDIYPFGIYLEILAILNGLAGTTTLESHYEKSKQKMKVLMEHYK